MKNIILIVQSVILLIGFGFFSLHYVENPKNIFNNYTELEASGLIEKGWVPNYIPKSSTNINERHSIDSNNVHMSFKYSANDHETINKLCKLLVENKIGKKYVCPPFEENTSEIGRAHV